MESPAGIKYVAFKDGSSLCALFAGLCNSGRWAAYDRAITRMRELNVPSDWVTNIALTGAPISSEAADQIVESVQWARQTDFGDHHAASSLPRWIKWLLAAIVFGLVGMVVLGHFYAAAAR